MEVTNTNSNNFAPKLGSVSKDTIPGNAFSSHLREAAPNPRPRSDERTAQRDERSEPSNRAEVAENRNDDQARDANAEPRESNHDRQDETSRDENSSDGENENTSHQAIADDLEQGTIGSAPAGDDVAIQQELSFGDEIVTAETGATTGNSETITSISEKSGDTIATSGDIAATSNTELGDTNRSSNGLVDTATAQAQNAQEQSESVLTTNTGTTANAEKAEDIATTVTSANLAASDATKTSTDKPAANLGSVPAQTTQSTNLNADSANDPAKTEAGLPNPLEAGADGDPGAGSEGEGEKGLGQQAAENMADKNNGTDTSQKIGATQSATPQVTAQTITPSPVQALTSFGLNASSLPTDLDLDLLGLNGPGAANGGSSPQNSNATLVRFGALPGQAQATQVPNTAIALQIAKHISKGVATFQIRLDPAEMGRIDVKLEMAQDGRATAHLAVEKPETLDLLQRDAKALEQALKDAGLDVDSDALNFSLQDGDASSDFASEAGENGEANADDDDNLSKAHDDALVTAMAARQIDAAARGGIDVSI